MQWRAIFFLLVGFLLSGASCGQETDGGPPSAVFLLQDPQYRTQFETAWETRPFPLFRRAETLERLRAHLQRRGVRAPAGLWRRVLPELPADAALRLALESLENYPGEPPVPTREDATAAFLIRFAAGPAFREEALARHFLLLQGRILKKIGRHPGLADFRFEARRAIVETLPVLCRPHPDAEGLFGDLLRADLPASLRARTLAALGICGFRSPDLVDLVMEDLFRVRDHAQLAAFARTAFSGARGAARARVLSGIERVLTDSAWRAHPPFLVLSRMDSPLHRKDFPPEAYRDPVAIPRAFARLLADMGEGRRAARILRSAFSVERRGEAAREAFDALWETLMEAASDPAQWQAALVQGTDVALRAVTLDFAMRECPDFLLELRFGGILMDVGQTEREWLESFRDEALRKALADASRSAELTRRWNRETTEEAQWNATRELWAPFVKVPGEDVKNPCAASDPFEGASPREWLRMRLAMALWVCRPAGPGPAWPSMDFLRDRVTAPDFSLPWDAKKEEARRARVAACMQKRMERLQEWESRELDACRDSFDCVWDALVRRGASWPAEALRRALERLRRMADASVWAHFDGRFAQVPPSLAEAVLEWAAPRLSGPVRERIRDDLSTKCREETGCLSLWLHAIRLANESEVSHD